MWIRITRTVSTVATSDMACPCTWSGARGYPLGRMPARFPYTPDNFLGRMDDCIPVPVRHHGKDVQEPGSPGDLAGGPRAAPGTVAPRLCRGPTARQPHG